MSGEPKKHRRSEAQIRNSLEATAEELSRITRRRSREWWIAQCKAGLVRHEVVGEGRTATYLISMADAVRLVESGKSCRMGGGGEVAAPGTYSVEDAERIKLSAGRRRVGAMN